MCPRSKSRAKTILNSWANALTTGQSFLPEDKKFKMFRLHSPSGPDSGLQWDVSMCLKLRSYLTSFLNKDVFLNAATLSPLTHYGELWT